MEKYKLPETRGQKITRSVFVILTAAAILFQLFQAAGFAVNYQFMRPYATALLIFSGLLLAALILSLCKKYLLSLIGTAVGTVGIAAVGYMLTHPITETDGLYISGVPEAAFWKNFAPCLLLIIPAVMLFVNELRRRKLEEETRPYEKQF